MRRFVWIALVLIGIVALSWPFRERIYGTALEQSRSAYNRGDWRASLTAAERWLGEHPEDLDALRIKARDLAKLGRGAEAIGLFGQLGGDRMQAVDLELLSDALIRANRGVLALAALNAATKIDPKNLDVLTALAELSSSKEMRPSITKMADHLASIASGPGLAELVLDLALTDKPEDSAGDRPSILDSVLRSDRSIFLGVDGPSAARKLVARKLLERGRTADAQEWIRRVSEQDDHQTNWLMSRVLLAEGKLESADVAAAMAGSYGHDDLTAHEPAPYVGAKRCAECHKTIYETQQQSAHASTIASGDAMMAIPLPNEPIRDPEDPNVTHRIERTNGKVQLKSDVHGQVVAAVLDYALGSGRHGMTMLARQEAGPHRQLRISYYSTGGGHWDLTSGFERRPRDIDSFIGEPLSEESFVKCLNCHTTRFTSERERTGPEAADHGIGCERCHGPGGHHLRSVELGFSDLAIARPKSATPAQRFKVCKECHGADGVIPPSDPRFVRFQAANLPYSRCVTESNGRLDCVACHDPHRNIVKEDAHYEVRCLACHGGGKSGNSASSLKELRLEAFRASSCPINAKSGCIDCHMPKSKEVMPFTKFTDHHIRVHMNRDAE